MKPEGPLRASRLLLWNPALTVAVCRAEISCRDRFLPIYGAHQAGCRSTSFRARGHEARKEQRSTNRDRRSARHERTLTPTVDVPVPHRRLLPPSTPLPLRPPPLLCTCTALSKAVKSSCTMFATSIGRMLCQNQQIFASACKSCAISVQFCRTYGHHGRSFACATGLYSRNESSERVPLHPLAGLSARTPSS